MTHPRSRRAAGLLVLGAAATALVLPASPASATTNPKPINGIASVALSGKAAKTYSTEPTISNGGRFVAFVSKAPDLTSSGSNGKEQIFVRDTLAATTTLVSVSSGGITGNADSDDPIISANGRYLVWQSAATNLVAGDTNGHVDVFRRDLVTKQTIRASVRTAGGQLTGGDATNPLVSGDGKEVSFQYAGSDVVAGDTNAKPDVFVREVDAGFSEMITVTSGELMLTAGGTNPSMSANGRYVVFDSNTTQVGTDTNGRVDVFLRDRVLGTTELVGKASDGTQGEDGSQFGKVSDDGRYVAFQSSSKAFTTATVNGTDSHIYRRDRTNATTVLVDLDAFGQPGTEGASGPDISANGNAVSFASESPNLWNGDSNGNSDAFVRNVSTQTTTRVDTKTGGTSEIHGLTFLPALSDDGTAVTYVSFAADAYPKDSNNTCDVFWRGTAEAGPFTDTTGLIQQSNKDFNGAALPLGKLVPLNDAVLYGTGSTQSVIDDMAHGTFDDHRGPVTRLYWSFFHRLPDPSGFTYWVNKHASGTSLRKIANEFAKSSEFKTKYGTVSDTAFITLVYQNVLERQPDAAGLAHWVAKLHDGVSRGEMMTNFSESSEGIRHLRPETDTVLLYLGLLRALPTKQQLTFGAGLLLANGGQPTEVLVDALITSSAYQGRFI